MLIKLYPVIFLFMTFFASVWAYQAAKERTPKFSRTAFWVLFAGFFAILIFADGSFWHKFGVVFFRDLIFIGITALIVRQLIEKKFVLLLFAIAMLIFVSAYYYGVLRRTFQPKVELATNGEILFDIKKPDLILKISEELDEFDPQIRKAFPGIRYAQYSELDDYYILDVPEEYADDVGEILEELNETGAVDWAERNEVVSLSPLDEEKYSGSFDIDYLINDPQLNTMWSFYQMKMNDLYKLLLNTNRQPVEKCRLAILDTGVDSEHEDIAANFFSISPKYNTDKNGHGTHCAGIACAVSNNQVGVASFSPNNQLVEVSSVKVLSDAGSGSQQSIIQGIIEAADNGADVISLSLGGPSVDDKQKAYNEAIAYANKSGAIVIVAAGNSNDNAANYAPANCKGVIVVTAVDDNLDRASFSNAIEDIEMGIAAPGVEILSTFPNNTYRSMNGTSMATPYVAGLVAVMKAFNPNLTTEQVFKILTETGIDTDDTEATGRFIQPEAALRKILK